MKNSHLHISPDTKVDPDKKYYVHFAVSARFCAEVQGSTLRDLVNTATNVYCDADFGEASDLEASVVSIEDENGDFLTEDRSVLSCASRRDKFDAD